MHPDGHQMIIAHKSVSALHRKQLESLPIHKADGGDTDGETLGTMIGYPGSPKPKPHMMADGGDPEEWHAPEALPEPSTAQQIGSMIHDAGIPPINFMKGIANAVGPTIRDFSQGILGSANAADRGAPAGLPAQPPSQAQPSIPAQPPSSAQPHVPGADNFMGDLSKYYSGAQNAIGQQQQVDVAKAQAAEQAQNQYLKDREAFNQQSQSNLQQLMQHRQDAINDYANGHIDPKSYLNEMGTGSKIATGIGLLLGGFASARTGNNAALQMLQKRIDQNIEAQKLNSDKQRNLIAANRDLYGDQIIGDNQTKINMNDMLDHEIQLAAAQQGTQQAKINAQNAHFQLAAQSNGLLQQNAMRASVLQQLQNGGASDPATRLRLYQAAGMITPEQYAQGNKELESAQEIEKLRADLHNSFDDLNNQFLAGKLSPADRDSAINTFSGRLAKLGEGRFNFDEAKQQMNAIMPGGFESGATRQKKGQRTDALMDTMKNTPVLNGLGITVPRAHMAPIGGGGVQEGAIAVGPGGRKLQLQGGRWVPYGG